MGKEVTYTCDRCGKELSKYDYGGIRIRAKLLGRTFTICKACDRELTYWLYMTGRYKE